MSNFFFALAAVLALVLVTGLVAKLVRHRRNRKGDENVVINPAHTRNGTY